MNKHTFILMVVFTAMSFVVNAQANYLDSPYVGKSCPDFVLHNIKYYPKKQATLKDFTGKWLVLDFWNKYCGACVASFPRVNAMQQKFGDKVQYMLVGIQDKEKQIEPMYAKFREKEKLVMPCAFDSALAKRWDIYAGPDVLLIDPQGIIQARTTGFKADELEGFLSGHPPKLAEVGKKYNTIPFDKENSYLSYGNGGNDSMVIFRSVLTTYNQMNQSYFMPEHIDDDVVHGRFQVIGVPLYCLYNYAYVGERFLDEGYSNDPLLETKDSTLFKWSSYSGKNMFAYSVQVPSSKASKEGLQKQMWGDLDNYFGFKVTIEERNFPVWRLRATKQAAMLLKTKGGKELFRDKIPKNDFTLKNSPFKQVPGVISYDTGKEIIDETGITGNVDISVDDILDGIVGMNKSLKKYGLNLVESEQIKKVLVIKDK